MKALRRLGIALATLVVALGLGEVAARLFTDVTPPILVRDPVIGRRLQPGLEAAVWDAEIRRDVPLRINALGFRGPDRPEAKPAGVKRLSLLGDSMVASMSLEEPELLTSLLEQRLEAARPVTDWDVINWGVPASSNAQELVLYREHVRDFDSDVVVLGLFAGNDLADNSRRLTSYPRIYFDFDESGALVQQPFSGGRAAASRWLNRHSRFYVWQKTLARSKPILAISEDFRPELWIFARETNEDVEHAWSIMRATLELFRDEVRADGAELVVCMIPCAEQIYTDAFEMMLEAAAERGASMDPDEPERRVAAFCEELGVPFHSLVPALREASAGRSLADESAWLFYGGRGHWNARGNAVGAESLARFLVDGGFAD